MPGIVEWLKEVTNSTLFLGAAGGLTNALVTKMALRETFRHAVIGLLAAYGLGDIIGRIAGYYLAPDNPELRAIISGGGGPFLSGLFGASFIERFHSVIKTKEEEEEEEKENDVEKNTYREQ